MQYIGGKKLQSRRHTEAKSTTGHIDKGLKIPNIHQKSRAHNYNKLADNLREFSAHQSYPPMPQSVSYAKLAKANNHVERKSANFLPKMDFTEAPPQKEMNSTLESKKHRYNLEK